MLRRSKLNRTTRRGQQLTLMIVLLLAGAAVTAAQSSDRDNPTPLSANTIKGSGTAKKVEYYYGFNAGPGEVVFTVDLKARAGSTSAEVEIFDADSSKIFYYYPNATTQNERAVKRFTVNSKQTVTLRLALDSSAGDYAIKLGGAVELAPTQSSVPGSVPSADASVASGSSASTADESAPAPQSDVAPPTEVPTSVPGSGPAQKTGKGSKLDLGINLLQTVGTHFGLPTSGWLRLVMKDGTSQDIDLSKVKSAAVSKQ